MGEKRIDFFLELANGSIQFSSDGLNRLQVGERAVISFSARDRFNAANARRHSTLGGNAEITDLTGGTGVCAAAKFHRVAVELAGLAANLNDADPVTIFLTEEMSDPRA